MDISFVSWLAWAALVVSACVLHPVSGRGEPKHCGGVRGGSSSSELIFNFTTSGPFSISLGEEKDVWITSGEYGVRVGGKLMVLGEDLISNATDAGNGEDALGAYQSDTIKWMNKDTKQEVFHTIFKSYTTLPAVVFEQFFPIALNETSSGNATDMISAFPTFSASDQAITNLNYITYEGTFPRLHLGHFDKKMDFHGGASGGVPLILHDKSLRTLVISPLDNFMVGMHVSSKAQGNVLACGINGRVTAVPEGFSHSTIMWSGQGLKDTLYEWGGALLKYHGKTRTTLDSDFSVQYLGWWTDNGGYYHYQTEKNKTYQQTMLDAKAKLEELKIPVRYFQLDSWWYYQEFPRGPVTLWEPRPDVFPGLMSDWLGLPLSLHNRWFAAKNNYSADWFLVDGHEDCALPASKELYDTIMGKTVKWGPGMFQYEQDWLTKTFGSCSYAQTDIKAAGNWLTDMAQAAADLNITIQYCMAQANHMLQSTALQAVTVSRATTDYSASSSQWSVGKTSLLYHAIGVIPFKDCFQTVTVNEEGCPHKDRCQETNPTLQALASVLSTGPIAPADGIQFMNEDTANLLKRTCRWSDGLILKPDVPAITMDVVFQMVFSDDDPEPFDLWHTYSDVGGARFHYILAAVLDDPFELTLTMLGEEVGHNFIAYDYIENCKMAATKCNFTTLRRFNDSSPLNITVPKDEGVITQTGKLPTHPFKYYIITPVMESGWTLLGEGEKFVVASAQRFTSVTGDTGSGGLVATITGTDQEEVTVYARAPSGQLLSATGAVGASLTATVKCHEETGQTPACSFTSS